jgi:predicted negative regulator of RcsB-dependent stress response
MPTATPLSRDAALETHVFWLKHKVEILAAIAIALLAAAGFGGYRFYTGQRSTAAAELLGSATTDQDYEKVIAQYPQTPAAASAYLFLAESQRKAKNFAGSNTTLQPFIDKNPDHELVPTAKMAIAANLESLGKMDEALAQYQQVAASYPKNFNAPMALISEVSILKAKNRTEEARQVCERIMTDYRESFWMGEAARQLRLLKPAGEAQTTAPKQAVPPLLAAPSATPFFRVMPSAAPSAPPQPGAPPGKPR